MIKGHPQTDGGALFVSDWWGAKEYAPQVPSQISQASADARMQYAPTYLLPPQGPPRSAPAHEHLEVEEGGGGGEHDERGIGAVSGLALGDAIALAAAVAVRLHADAGRLASGEARGKEGHPIAAMDVAEHLPQARQRLRARALPTPRTTKK